MSFLRSMVTDGTWDQDQQVERLARLHTHEAHCLDLTSATDRFPVVLQRDVISAFFGMRVANL
jgi:hypothetical protein